jgi:hypothetical protein
LSYIFDSFNRVPTLFPFTVSGSVRIAAEKSLVNLPAAVAVRIEEMLDSVDATSVTINGPNVRFTTRLFRLVWNWNILVPFDRGDICVEAKANFLTVRYRLSTGRMLLIVTTMILRQNGPFLAVAWIWLFGMNYLIGAIRFPMWLRSGLRNGSRT